MANKVKSHFNRGMDGPDPGAGSYPLPSTYHFAIVTRVTVVPSGPSIRRK
jgi:hypothetical protein